MSALTAQTLGVLVHGLRLRGESYAADVIERLAAPATDAQVEAAATEIYIRVVGGPMVRDSVVKRYSAVARAALEAAREVSDV